MDHTWYPNQCVIEYRNRNILKLANKLPVSEKLTFLSYLSLTLSPLSRISSALSPRTVTWAAIFSFLLMPKLLMVNLALDGTGFWPVKSSKTFEAKLVVLYLWLTYHLILQHRCLRQSFRFWFISLGFIFPLWPCVVNIDIKLIVQYNISISNQR